jgi:hypothetical protein
MRVAEAGDVTGWYEKERWEGGEKRRDDMEGIWEDSGEAWRRAKYGNLGIRKFGDM